MENTKVKEELGSKPDYNEIIAEAKAFAGTLKGDLPRLPSEEELDPYQGLMWAKDRGLVDAVRRHLDEWGSGYAHGFDHVEWVAVNAAYVAETECNERGIRGDLRDEIIQRTWRLGLLHDLQRWRGYEFIHAEEGSKAARQKLKELEIDDPYLEDMVLVHDRQDILPRNNPAFDIPHSSVFAVDHLLWGSEWEEVKWGELAEKGLSAQEVLNECSEGIDRMLKLRQSPALGQTKWGREVALPYIDYGVQIARHIKRKFGGENV